MSAPLLSVSHVHKRYGSVVALDDVSLDVGAGEFFALLGPSGCGKTTLMRGIAGFETPDSGRIALDGDDLDGVPPYRRPVNMMFQSYALFPHLDVFGNIAFGLRRKGEPVDARVSELLEMMQLAPYGRRKISELSGGQRQRVALARALAPRPRLLLLDEPLGALDRKLREETQFHLKEIQRLTRTSFVIVTHDQDEALALADRIAVMRAGRVEQIASPAEIYDRPATRFVAGFVGDTNFIDGRLSRAGGAAALVTPFAHIPLDAAFSDVALPAAALPDGAGVTMSVRPERIAIGDAGFEGLVEDFVYRGETTLLRIRVAGDIRLRVSAAHGVRFAKGETLRLTISPDAGVLFEAPE